jgi:UDP-glucose-4-epimerase GalE
LAAAMNILVSGGAGYIGSHTCKALAAKGYTPIVYDNLSRGNSWAVKWGPFEKGELADAERLRALLKRYAPVAVMHFAAYAYVGESCSDPLLYYRNNVGGSQTLLQTLVSHSRVPVVFSSTCATYGTPQRLPLTEDHPQTPVNPYGFTKLVVERMLADIDRAYGVRSVILRYFNAAGADPDAEIGEVHDPETHLIPLVLAAARSRGTLDVYGCDYDTPDGTCIRDYVHVTDLADAHVRSLEYLLAGAASVALNLANARGYSVREVIAAAEDVTGLPVGVRLAARRVGDPPVLVGDATRARTLLGWQPMRSDLRIQLTDAWRWTVRASRNA